MTDIDSRADIGLSYHDAELHVAIPLTGQVSEMWCQRYEALARAKDVKAMVRGKPDGPARLYLAIPAKARGSEVEAMLDTARALLAEADAVDQAPASSAAAEAVARQWWIRQRT
ncbi:MAG TPA: hypothetical protein VGS19_20260 [Streptosporangiaceae bacterium]|nr:hypothetical protein [Streptosporangiaceae bacterium]